MSPDPQDVKPPTEGQSVTLTSDEAKALRRLIPELDAYPMATGLSHLVGLLVRDAATFRAYKDSPSTGGASSSKRVYLSGPMTGYPEFNYPAFAERAKAWRAAGWTVLNPAENFGGDQQRTYAEYMRKDIEDVLSVEAIALLPGYEKSKGAQLELSIAKVLGLTLYDAMTFAPLALCGDAPGGGTASDRYVIWSGEHSSWWGPDSSGYTPSILGAGLYSREDAERVTAMCGPERQITIRALADALGSPRDDTAGQLLLALVQSEGSSGAPST